MAPSPRARLAMLVARGAMDAELAALVTLLLQAHVPVIVAGPPGDAREALVDALLDLVSDASRVVVLEGPVEEFEWLPEAAALGWRRERRVPRATAREVTPRVTAATTTLVTRDLAGQGPSATGGPRARIVVRALTLGYGLVAGMTADGLEGVLSRFHDPEIAANDDERSRLGLVLAIGEPAAGPRILAAHYVRPASRDSGGHLQRLPPAVLATWNADTDCWDHFAWGVLPELALRVGMRPIEFERAQARLAAQLPGADTAQ